MMKKYFLYVLVFFITSGLMSYRYLSTSTKPTDKELKIIFIRHGEKPEKGGNLNCKGLNRSLQLPALIKQKFGVPDFIYVPSLKMAEKTSHARMFETVAPLAAKYNLDIDSKYEETDSTGVATDIMQKKGTVLVVWEHKAISGILHALSINGITPWDANDYDTILIVTFKDGKPVITRDKEGLNPSEDCP